MRNLLFLVVAVVIMILSIPLLLFVKLTKTTKITPKYINFWSKCINLAAGNKIEVYGYENYEKTKEPIYFVCNHESFFDFFNFFAIISDRPITFLSKKELSKVPLVSSWMKTLHVVFLDRDNNRQMVKDIRLASDYLKAGLTMGVCPEGTRSIEDQEFKPGSIKPAINAKVTIIPITFRNTASLFENRKTSRRQTSFVCFHEPITYDEYKDKDMFEITHKIQKIIHGKKF